MGPWWLYLLAVALNLEPVEWLALRYSGCYILTQDLGDGTVAVKWVCSR